MQYGHNGCTVPPVFIILMFTLHYSGSQGKPTILLNLEAVEFLRGYMYMEQNYKFTASQPSNIMEARLIMKYKDTAMYPMMSWNVGWYFKATQRDPKTLRYYFINIVSTSIHCTLNHNLHEWALPGIISHMLLYMMIKISLFKNQVNFYATY